MEDSDEFLLSIWRANLVVLTQEVGAATRLARMMTFSASYLKLMLSGQREFSEEFVRGVEAVSGLPAGWMNTPHEAGEIPANAREAIDNEMPLARFRGKHIGIVFQAFHLIPTMTALENVAVPLELAGMDDPFGRAERELIAVGLGGRLSHYPAQLSGGEQQRVALARAFMCKPPILMAWRF